MISSAINLIKTKLKLYSGFIIAFIIALLIISLMRNIAKTVAAQKRIQKEEARVESLRVENEKLRERLEKETSEAYIEKQMRDKLGLAKKGETIVILPDEETLKKLAPVLLSEEDVLPDPNWKKWLNLFF